MPRVPNQALSYFLSNNVVPNQCEAASIQIEMDYLAAHISRLRSKLTKLEKQFWSYSIMLSPVRRVPAEILGEIFTFVIPDDVLEEQKRCQLVDLQLVCRSWRDAARLQHRLWSGLYVSLRQTIPLEKIQNWFGRSGNTPKSLQVFVPGHGDCETQGSPCRLHSLALATLVAKGLSRFSLTCKGPQCFHNFLDALKTIKVTTSGCAWDCLDFIALKFTEEWNESPDPSKSMFFRLPPNVTSFELELPSRYDAFGSETDSAITPLHIPPSFLIQLRSLSLRCDWQGLQWLECVLPLCTNVQTLKFNFFGLESWEYDTSSNEAHLRQRLRSGFLLPQVHTLCLQNLVADSHPMDILSLILTPQLVDLDIGFHRNDPEESDWKLAEHIIAFAKRSSCGASLRRFRLRHVQLKAGELANALRALPFLTHLTLEDIVMTEAENGDAFYLLKTDAQPSLSRLETLELLHFKPNLCHNLIQSFLQSRRPYRWDPEKQSPPSEVQADTLKRLIVTFQTIPKERQLLKGDPVLRALREHGVTMVHIGPISYID
ncbi:hypothetical protein MD484_g6250, partial [Candolleomyces efflorescens]